LVEGKRIPLYAFAANKDGAGVMRGLNGSESFEDIISKYELVAMVFAQLQVY